MSAEQWRSVTAQLSAQQKKRTFLIDPRSSVRLAWWDAAGGAVLIFTAMVTPFEVAFLPPADDPANSRFIINRFIDLFFMIDMLVQLMIMYPLDNVAALAKNGGAIVQRAPTQLEMVTSHRDIAARYLRGWFLVDAISVLTCLIDIVPLSLRKASSSANDFDEDAVESLRILRVLRVMRLIKLVRLLKTSRLLKRWQTHLALDFSTQTMLSALASYLLAGHWFACILVLITTVSDTQMHTWLAAKGYCVRASDPASLHGGSTWQLQPIPHVEELSYLTDVYCVSAFDLWAATYFWMMQVRAHVCVPTCACPRVRAHVCVPVRILSPPQTTSTSPSDHHPMPHAAHHRFILITFRTLSHPMPHSANHIATHLLHPLRWSRAPLEATPISGTCDRTSSSPSPSSTSCLACS